MRNIDVNEITSAIEKLFEKANFELPSDVVNALIEAEKKENSMTGKEILEQILLNSQTALKDHLPLCQDCGTATVFMEIGQDVAFSGGDLKSAINEGVRKAYNSNYLRKSIVNDPLTRINTQDNTPAVIHFDIVPGDKVRIIAMPKGGGCENMSFLKMMLPSDGIDSIKRFILESVRTSGANPCPPTILGIGIGGNLEQTALMAKKALLRKIGAPNPDPDLDALEKEILAEINNLGIGPQGLGGNTTCLAVHILKAPCHIASMPVCINTGCHSHRHKEITI
ncbi:MAG: fumarate hydratase [Spirochaetales bacterium]|nr:fumarate hydratase [Spirochaetales bacterium]